MVTQFELKISVSPDAMLRQVGGECVILDLKTDRYLGLDEVGTRMWQVLTSANSIESAYQALSAEFDVEAGQLRADLDEFVQELVKLGLIGFGQ